MNELLVHRRVGHVLWDIARVEQGANAAFALLAHLPDDVGITDTDRRTLLEKIRPEEQGHDRMMSHWARLWSGPAPKRAMPYSAAIWRDLVSAVQLPAEFRLAYVLATIHWNETNTLRSKQFILSVLERLDAGPARDWRQLVEEERGHVAWATGLLARLEHTHPSLVRKFHRYRDYTAMVYPALVNRSHSASWSWVATHLGVPA
jgi:hypothetical protein